MATQEACRTMVLTLMKEFEEEIGKLSVKAAKTDAAAKKRYSELIGSLRIGQEVVREELMGLVEKEAWEDFHKSLKSFGEEFRKAVHEAGVVC